RRRSLFPYTTLFRSCQCCFVIYYDILKRVPYVSTFCHEPIFFNYEWSNAKEDLAVICSMVNSSIVVRASDLSISATTAFSSGLRSEEHTSELQSRFE